MRKQSILSLLAVFILISTVGIISFVGANKISQKTSPEIISLSLDSSYPGEEIIIYGQNFGSNNGYIVITGLQLQASFWSNTEIRFIVPDIACSGFLYVRDSESSISNKFDFSIKRNLDEGYFEPFNLEIKDTGMLGAAFLVETDGEYIYGITGFETLSTFEIRNNQEYDLCSRTYLPQRVGDLKLCNGYLFCSGDHGLVVFRCSDLQQGNTNVIAGISGNHFLGVDVKLKTGNPINGILLALCDYLPDDSNELSLDLFKFENEELIELGSYSRAVISTERQHAIAIDPLYAKVYVSGGETLLGSDKYILEFLIDDPSNPTLNHREETGKLLAFDMDAGDNILWTGVVFTGTEFFRTYNTFSGASHIVHDKTITGAYGLGRTTRVRIIDETTTVGSAWSGARPDVFLLETYPSSSTPLASCNSLDWAFDVTGYVEISEEYDGKIIVADEWGGFLTYEYSLDESIINHVENYHWAPASAMTENIHLTDDRVYIANRGAGVWSAERDDISDETQWRLPEWEWGLEEPQPYPVSSLAIRDDPVHGLLIAGLAHDKAMAWGTEIYGTLYKETTSSIERLAISEGFDPPGLYSTGVSVEWPEPDLVYMTTGSDGIRAYVVNPDEPSINIHSDCLTNGFGEDVFSTNNMAACMKYYSDGVNDRMIVGTIPGLLVSSPTIHIFDISYPNGVPDRNNPDRTIEFSHFLSLDCSQYKPVNYIDVTDEGIIVVATDQGIGLFDIDWVSDLNELSVSDAWEKIFVSTDSFSPFWDENWSPTIKDAAFAEDNIIYCVKNPQGRNPGGLWRLNFEIDQQDLSNNCYLEGFYPGVQCGMDYSYFLQGWGNPDIRTIHHPYALAADENGIFVTGWSGKVDEMIFTSSNLPPTIPVVTGTKSGKIGEIYSYTAGSTDPEGSELEYYFEWGDGTNSNWQSSSTQVHSWNTRGSYDIKVKARDEKGAESGWGKLTVTMPKIKDYRYNLFDKIFDFFDTNFAKIKSLIDNIRLFYILGSHF